MIGCGEVGKSAIQKAINIGANVTAIDINEDTLNSLKINMAIQYRFIKVRLMKLSNQLEMLIWQSEQC